MGVPRTPKPQAAIGMSRITMKKASEEKRTMNAVMTKNRLNSLWLPIERKLLYNDVAHSHRVQIFWKCNESNRTEGGGGVRITARILRKNTTDVSKQVGTPSTNLIEVVEFGSLYVDTIDQ